jgi:ubiquinone/menaquinone biosynthesis C-methylase UbiE
MGKPMSNLSFRLMSFEFKLRDLLRPRKNILEEVGIKVGFSILDYGCGPGSYSIIAAELVGPKGRVYALDIHPLAVQRVQNVASKRHLVNIQTILSDCATGLENNSVDVALLYDTLHDLSDADAALEELHRVLKPDGMLSFNDHHMKEDEIVSRVANRGLFRLSGKGERTYSFRRMGAPERAASLE